MWQVKVETFPNNEIRRTFTKEKAPDRGSDVAVLPSELRDEYICSETPSSPLLDISVKLDEPPKPSPRRPSKFGNDARRALLRSGAALDEFDPRPGSKLFLTGTLPSSTEQAYQAIAEHADFIVHRIKNWLGYHQSFRYDFYVWELQKRGALHIHYCAYLPDAGEHEYVKKHWHSYWCDTLRAVGKRAGVDMFRQGFGRDISHSDRFVQAPALTVHKSVARYLAKYCSKSAGACTTKPRYSPPRWWGRSRPLKDLTDSLSTVWTEGFATMQAGLTYLRNLADDLSSLSEASYSYRHQVGAGQTDLTYIRSPLWKMARKILEDSSTQSTKTFVQLSEKSSLFAFLKEYREILFLTKPSVMKSTESSAKCIPLLGVRMLMDESAFNSQEIKTLMVDLLALSASLNLLNRERLEEWWIIRGGATDRHPLSILWHCFDSVTSGRRWTWKTIESLDREVDKYVGDRYRGTTTLENDEGSTANGGVTPHSSGTQLVIDGLPFYFE